MQALANECQRRLRNNFPSARVLVDEGPPKVFRAMHGQIPICPMCGRVINLKDHRSRAKAGEGEDVAIIFQLCTTCGPDVAKFMQEIMGS